MKEIRKTTQFKKDFKRFRHDLDAVSELLEVVRLLERGEDIPKANRPHQLQGRWKNHMECHIGNDYLLIWYDRLRNVVELVRLGSHSELFG